jgi:uncharacterized protein (DUF342 family)
LAAAEQARAADEAKRHEEEATRMLLHQAKRERMERLTAMQAALNAHEEKVTTVQKKLKALRKKLRDIADLEVKRDQGEKLSAEQKEKVGRHTCYHVISLSSCYLSHITFLTCYLKGGSSTVSGR